RVQPPPSSTLFPYTTLFRSAVQLLLEVYKDFDITEYSFRLSYRDPEDTEKYFDDDQMWEQAESMLKEAMDDLGLDYVEAEGEARSEEHTSELQSRFDLVCRL